MARLVWCRVFLRRTRSRRRRQTPAPPPVDDAVRAVAAVLAKVAADAVVKAADAVPAKVADVVVRAADAAPAKVDAGRARAEEAHGRADADLVREASRHVIRRLLRSSLGPVVQVGTPFRGAQPSPSLDIRRLRPAV